MAQEHATQFIPVSLREGGTKLYLMSEPPASNAKEDACEKPTFVGYIMHTLGVPRWMSSHFSDVLAEQDLNEAKLELYPHDWMEKIVYQPVSKELPEQGVDLQSGAAALVESVVAVSATMQHQLSTGCQQLSPRTTIQAATGPRSDLDQKTYYALVSQRCPDNPAKVKEVIIATLDNRSKFAFSAMHAHTLNVCNELRAANPNVRSIVQRRSQVFNALQVAVPAGFQP